MESSGWIEASRAPMAAFIAIVLPPGPARSPELEARVLEHVLETLRYVPEAAELPFRVGLWSLEQLGWVMAPAHAPLSRLPRRAAEVYVERWAHGRIGLLRDFFKALKGFVMLAYYEQPEVAAAMGYAPQAYIDDLKAKDGTRRD